MSFAAQRTIAFLPLLLLLVNGCVAPSLEIASPPPMATGTVSAVEMPDEFSQQLRDAVAAADFTAMRGLMDDNLFVIAFWPGNSLPPLPADDGLGQLRSLHMTGGPITFPEPDAPLSEFLDGQDPLHIFQSDIEVVE